MVRGGENLLNENNIRFFAGRAIESLNEYFADRNMRGISPLGAKEVSNRQAESCDGEPDATGNHQREPGLSSQPEQGRRVTPCFILQQ